MLLVTKYGSHLSIKYLEKAIEQPVFCFYVSESDDLGVLLAKNKACGKDNLNKKMYRYD
jgi:hypothetical protein